MPKLKTKSSAKKRFKVSGTGKIIKYPSGKRHGMSKRTNKFVRQNRGPEAMSESDASFVRKFMPYSF